MSQQGWIKLHRNIMESSTFKTLTSTQKLIAIYLVLNANHEDGMWFDQHQGVQVEVKRGQLITSRNKIANEWFKNDKDITEQKVRTALVKLEKLDFLTIESTNRYTVINIVNYSVYQASEKEINQQDNQGLTKAQPGLNQGLTTNKNDKECNKNDKEDINTSSRKRVYDDDSSYMKMAKYFLEKIKEWKPDYVFRGNMQTWADDFRKLSEIDKRSKQQIKDLIDWVVTDSFWQANILSPKKMRDKINQLEAKMKGGSSVAADRGHSPGYTTKDSAGTSRQVFIENPTGWKRPAKNI